MTAYVPAGSRIGGAVDSPLAVGAGLTELPRAHPDSVVVGVIDTGIAVDPQQKPHPFIANNLIGDWSGSGNPPAGLDQGHGSFVTGLILDEEPTAAIAMRGVLASSSDDAANDEAVAAAIANLGGVPGIRIINMSFFAPPGQEVDRPLKIKQALRDLFANHPDILVVTAAGNSWTNARSWPAAFSADFEQVIAVGAVDESIIAVPGLLPPKASFSNYGTWVSAYAPGVHVLGPGLPIDQEAEADDPTTTTWGWRRWSGTSFAAATVTGLLAQALTGDRSLTGAQARERVIRGPRVPIAGLREEDWRPYVHGRQSTWLADTEAAQRR